MRYAIVSDIHSNIVALESVLDDLEYKDYERLICLGDIIGYGPKPKDCLRTIKDNADIIIQGNHDRMVSSNYLESRLPQRVKKGLEHSENQLTKSDLEWLSNLDEKERIDDDFLVAHSHPRIRDKYVYPREFERMFPIMDDLSVNYLSLGHTHIQKSKINNTSEKKYHILNPGSVGQPRDKNPDSAYAILDTKKEKCELYRSSYDVEKVVSQVDNCEFLPKQNGNRLKKGK